MWCRVLEANKKQVPLKSYSLEIRINSVNQILKNHEKVKWTCNISMLTRITDQKILCVYIHVYQITKNWGPGRYNSLRHADNEIFFGSLFNVKLKGCAHVLLGKESGKIWTCSCWGKAKFMINDFKYGQTWKIWPSPLSLSLCSTLLYS